MHPPQPPRSKWKTWHTVLISILGGLVLMIGGIALLGAALSNDSSDEPEDTASDGIPEGFDAYLADLDAINPGIRDGRPEQAVFSDANNTCADIQSGTEEDILLDRTVQRYGVNEAEAIVTEDVAQQILDVTREHCDTIRPE
jgi:hypothetical protein